MTTAHFIFDATHLGNPQATGVENYVSALLPRLSQLLLKEGIAISWVGHSATCPISLPKGVTWIPSLHTPFWSQTRLLQLLQRKQPDLFFTPSGLTPVLYRGKTALTVHDMAAFLTPEAFTIGQRLRLRNLLRQSAIQAQVILTPSEFSKQRLLEHWPVNPKRVQVTPLGYSPMKSPLTPITTIDPSKLLILFIGRLEYKKNLLTVLEAFTALEDQTAQLVLAGRDGFGADELRQKIQELPPSLQARVHLPGYVSFDQREWLLTKASVMVVPGMLEGSSLPLLEAFAHQLPAICAQAGPLPEVGGEAVLYAGGTDVQMWTTQLTRILSDPKLAETLRGLGSQRLKNFNWDQTAKLSATALLTCIQ